MLKRLSIQNYALIDLLEIDFHQGLNIITGETGAGKSILLGALALILGSRAETNVLKDKNKPCVVEGLFDISGYNLNDFFAQNDLDYYNDTLIRRHISPTGKSRAFVNELPVNLTVLKDLVGNIIDIHSQHENLLLADSTFQLAVIDAFANNGERVKEYSQLFSSHKKLTSELNSLKEDSLKAKADFDYLQFQFNQLEEAKLKSGEDTELEMLQQQLAHAEDIKLSLQSAYSFLNNDSSSVLIWLKDIENNLSKLDTIFTPARELSSRVQACRIELKDVAREIELLNEKVELNPNQLTEVTQRLDLILTLLQKHRLKNVDDLINLHKDLGSKLTSISGFDDLIESKSKELDLLSSKAFVKAKEISEIRVKCSEKFEQNISDLLKQLGMPHAAFKVKFEHHENLQSAGIDRVSFQFSANKQIPLQELSRVASGGELSRLMLSLKSIMVKTKGLPTIILDEIDTGVSGEVADKVGNIINEMAKGMQVINITHLPQIASKGKYHFLVYKDNHHHTSKTRIKLLSSEERVIEIAKMLSGEKLSDAALINAKHLLKSNSDI